MTGVAKKFLQGNNQGLSGIENTLDDVNNALNPLVGQNTEGQFPFYNSGGRTLVRVGGEQLLVAQGLRWNVTYQGNEIRTIDTVHPWDISVGPAQISAMLEMRIDPTSAPEASGLLPIMQAAVHQPMVEIQALDKIGTTIFFSRGMFLGISGGVRVGELSSYTASFI